MGKNARTRARLGANYWQSRDYNDLAYSMYVSDLVRLATNRFRWDGLPDTVNVKYLEFCLLMNGYATIAHPIEMPELWYGLQVSTMGDLSAYGEPTEWQAIGANGKTWFNVKDGKNGVLVYGSNQFVNNFVPGYDSTWNMIRFLARKLSHFERTEDANLAMQEASWLVTCEQSKKQDAINAFKQVSGYEPAIIATPEFRNEIGFDVIKTDVPYIGEQLNQGKRNILNQAYTYLGIPHLDFEKTERMITSEAQGQNAPTTLRLLDALTPRRRAAKRLSEMLGNEVTVTLNSDLETMIYDFEQTQGLVAPESTAAEQAEEVSTDE